MPSALRRTVANADTRPGSALERLRAPLTDLLRGKETAVEAILSALLARGHVLLEDVPGVGKTTLVKAIARLLGLEMKRIQCTSDLLPSDIVGVEVFEPAANRFEFHKGPIFANLVLADELNRASPRTQSALLEAMGEAGVTVDRITHHLPQPFLLFATQNPNEHLGTYPLPESQLDRFSVKLQLSYPVAEKEREIFRQSTLDPLAALPSAVISPQEFQELQDAVESVHLSDSIVAYVSRVAEATRSHGLIQRGISTRGGVAWLRVAKGRAFLAGRDYVTPDDLIAVGPFALAHRIVVQPGNDAFSLVEKVLNSVDVT
jgi:MoxR-like ATPase